MRNMIVASKFLEKSYLFWLCIIILLCFLCFWFGRSFAANPRIAIVAAVGLPIAIASIKRPEFGLALLVVVMTNVFGIYHTLNVPHISFSFGTVQMTDMFFFLMLVPLLRDFADRRIKWKKTSLNKPLIILILILAPLQFFRGLFIQHEILRYVARKTRHLVYYSIFFIVLHEIRNKRQLDNLLKLLFLISVVSGVVSILQCTFNWNLSGSAVLTDPMTGFVRHYSSAWSMISSLFIVSFCALPFLKPRARLVVLICEAVLFLSILYTFARSLWGTVAVAIIVGLLLLGRDIGKVFKTLALVAMLLAIVVICLGKQKLESFIEPFQVRSSTAIPDFLGQKGTFRSRIDLLERKWDLMKAENFILGVGFKYYDPFLIKGADNGIAQLLFTLGIVGFCLFTWIFFTFFKRAFSLLKRLDSSLSKGIVIGLIAATMQNLLISFFSDPFFHNDGITVFVICWALVELIRNFYSKDKPVSLRE